MYIIFSLLLSSLCLSDTGVGIAPEHLLQAKTHSKYYIYIYIYI